MQPWQKAMNIQSRSFLSQQVKKTWSRVEVGQPEIDGVKGERNEEEPRKRWDQGSILVSRFAVCTGFAFGFLVWRRTAPFLKVKGGLFVLFPPAIKILRSILY